MSALAEASIETLLRWWEHPADFVREVFEVFFSPTPGNSTCSRPSRTTSGWR